MRAPRLAVRPREEQAGADARREQVLADVSLDRLEIGAGEPVLAVTRTARTTTAPIGELAVTARTDRFEVDYLIEV